MRWEQLVQPGQYTGNTGKSPHSSMHWQICRNAKKHADSSNSWLAEKLISTGTVSPVFALTFSSYSSSTMLPPCRLLPPRAHPSYSDSSQLLHLQQCWVLSCLSALTFPGPLRDILRITACVVPFPPLSRPSTRSLCIVTGGGAQGSVLHNPTGLLFVSSVRPESSDWPNGQAPTGGGSLYVASPQCAGWPLHFLDLPSHPLRWHGQAPPSTWEHHFLTSTSPGSSWHLWNRPWKQNHVMRRASPTNRLV